VELMTIEIKYPRMFSRRAGACAVPRGYLKL
jgi:hypothetical protein